MVCGEIEEVRVFFEEVFELCLREFGFDVKLMCEV